MIHSGDWIVPRLDGLRYFEKPIMGYWINSISMLIFGENNFGARFASALATLFTALCIYFLSAKQFKNSIGLVTASIYLLTVGVFIIGTVAVLDGMLNMAVTGAFTSFFFAFHSDNEKKRLPLLLLFGLSLGLGFLIKGFLVFAIVGLTTGTYFVWEFSKNKFELLKKRSMIVNIKLAAIQSLAILLPLLAVVLPWAILIQQKEPDFWRFFVMEEHIRRFMGKFAQHPEPFYFYIPILLIALLPWSLLLPMVISKWRSYKLDIPLVKYSLCWLILTFLFFSTSKGKLPTYILPAIPPVIILFAFGLKEYSNFSNIAEKWLHWLAGTLIVVITTATAVLILFEIIGVPGLKTDKGAAFKLFAPVAEWWKLALVIITAIIWVYFLWKLLRISDTRKKLEYFSYGPALLFICGMIAIPHAAIAHKAPGYFLTSLQNEIKDNTVIVSEYKVARAVCWFYHRENVYLLFTANEFGYGIDYDSTCKRRLLMKKDFQAVLKENKHNLVLILTRDSYNKYYIKMKCIPEPQKKIIDRSYAFLEY